jgi:hypothetical protein
MYVNQSIIKYKTIIFFISFLVNNSYSQSEVKKYYDKNGKDKIVKSIKKGVANYYTREDGMGMGPFLTTFDEIPKIGIACFNVNSKEYKHVRKS